MNIRRIESNTPNFSAKLVLSGQTSDISNESKKSWKNVVKDIGTDDDIITIHFEPLVFGKKHNIKNVKKLDRNKNVKAIYGSAFINGKLLYDNYFLGCRVSQINYKNELTDSLILEFVNKLKQK